MKYAAWIILFVFCFAAPAAAQTSTPMPPPEFTTQTDPVSLIGAFYNAINLGDYARAYSYWENPPQSMTVEQFATGFADTTSAHVFVRLPIATDAGAGNVFASLPVMVTAEHTDGTTHYYVGCFTVHKTNVPVCDAPEPDPNWYIQDGALSEQAEMDFAALENACDTSYTLTDNPFPPSQLDPLALLQAYFTALANDDITEALNYWESPPGDLFTATYGATVDAAESLSLIVNPVAYAEGAAGSVYVNVPALVITTMPDDTAVYITGCYVARGVNVPVGDAATPDPNWSLYDATLNDLPDAESAAVTLAQGCLP